MRKLFFIILCIPVLWGNANLKFTEHHSVELFLEKVEGYREKAYIDVDMPAICFGNRYKINGSPVEITDTSTRRQCLKMLQAHLDKRTRPILKSIHRDLTPTQKSALISFTYRHGLRGVHKTGLVKAINDLDRKRIRNIFLGQRGVLSRAKREWELWNRI